MNETTEINREYISFMKKMEKYIPHPITIFIVLTLLTIIISEIAAHFGLSVNYDFINETGQVQMQQISVRSFLNAEGLRYIFDNMIGVFITFEPLAIILIAILGVGVAEGSGFLKSILKWIAIKAPAKLTTATVILAGIISTIVTDVGYVFVIPLAGLIFLSYGRHPISGILAAFFGVTVGYGANLMVGPIDAILSGYTTSAAQIMDSTYHVSIIGNWFFMIVSTFVMVILGTLVTEKIIEPKLGRYKKKDEVEEFDFKPNEKRGLLFAAIAIIIYLVIIVYSIIPDLPFSGVLLDSTKTIYADQLLGPDSLFQRGIVILVSLLFLIAGIFYGICAKTIKNDKDVYNMMAQSVNTIGQYIVLIFFAAQFLHLFKVTNLGTILTVTLANHIYSWNFTGLPLLVMFILIVAFINLFLTSPTIKWSIISPIFVPIFMQLGLTPEFTQMLYRIGNATTNMITPLLIYFPLIVGFANKYVEDKNRPFSVGKLIFLMFPYAIITLIIWTLFIILWMYLGIPLGPSAPIYIAP